MFSRLLRLPRHCLARLAASLPSACALCGDACEDGLCTGCNAQFFRRAQCRCPRCATPVSHADGTQVCGDCMRNPPSFDATIVATDYAPPVDQLVLALKFGGRLALAPVLARLLHTALLQTSRGALPQLLSAVPLGEQRLAERGFNQALEIARPLSRRVGIRLDRALTVRTRNTAAQSALHPDQRHKNIRHAFVIPSGALERLRGLHVGVIDDVMTTGATLDELAATLKRFGAAKVTNIVFARTPPR